MNGMRMFLIVSFAALLNSAAFGQNSAKVLTFEVASIRPSERALGPEGTNRLTITPAGLSAKQRYAGSWRKHTTFSCGKCSDQGGSTSASTM
jgi:hypothetical protein